MNNQFDWNSLGAALLAVGVSVGTSVCVLMSAQVSAKEIFRDVKENYWATPFIKKLAEKGMIAGYRDGTFRPDKPVGRDEFAAMIRQAFNQDPIRQIPSGSAFKDVPKGYWAEPPIEEAYETGFMNASANNLFLPKKPLSKTEAVVALMEGLNMSYNNRPLATTSAATTKSVANNRGNQRRTAVKPLMFPIASTAMMVPALHILPKPQPQPVSNAAPAVAKSQNLSPNRSALDVVKSSYKDANKIPKDAVDDVAAATKANIVVNHPDVKVFNPNSLLNRGAAAALIHQALVSEGKLKPLPGNVAASKYIVEPASKKDETAQALK